MISPQFRAILEDGDATRERPLQVYGNDIKEIRRWAQEVLKSALPRGAVRVFQTIEQEVELIPKQETPAK